MLHIFTEGNDYSGLVDPHFNKTRVLFTNKMRKKNVLMNVLAF